jgi:hypothetical protein
MSLNGSQGVNSTRSWDGTTIPLPAKVLDIGSDKRGKWMFVKAAGTITQYQAGIVDKDGGFTAVTTTNASTPPKGLGIAQVAAATNEYLWVFIGEGGGTGSGVKVKVAASYVAGTKLYTTATAGVLDDSVTAGVISGVVGLTTDSGSGSNVEVQAFGSIYSNL